MNIEVFSVSKYEQNEDIWHIPENEDCPIVLCDGASESFNSCLWAKILSHNLTNHEDFTASWLKKRISEYEKNVNPSELSWSKQMAYERGSFAAFLSVQVTGNECLVNAVGDSEVFLVETGKTLAYYPYEEASEFLSHPVLLSTKSELNSYETERIGDSPYSGILDIGSATHILLMTDAIAHWFMKRKDNPDDVNLLLNIDSQNKFMEFVDRERKNDLRFDDTTMIRIDLREFLPMKYKRKLPAMAER